ncbi:hypothetical protein [Actinoplanes sp. CA-252034]|uniref:hypothetical protein n=1 Tax=Actinoplanes sp. CA-252034 TaxID=3239906 RepID=UPI003D978159
MPSRRWAALIVGGVAAVAGVRMMVRAHRSKRGIAGPVAEPAVPEPSTPRHLMPAASRTRRDWTSVIAAPLLAIMVLSAALVANRPSASGRTPADRLPREPNPLTRRLDPDVLAALRKARAASPALLPSPSPSPSPTLNAFGTTHDGFVAVPDADKRCTTPEGGIPAYRNPSPASVLTLDAIASQPCKTLILGTTAIVGGFTNRLTEITATLSETAELPSPGGTRITFRLHIRNLGDARSQTSRSWVLGAAQDTGWMFPVESWESTDWLPPSAEGDQYVVFEVAPGSRLARLRVASTVETVDWVVG